MPELPRLLFAAPASGSGKTTVTLAFLQALLGRGLRPAAFKCGPDYIDPLFHREVLGIPGHNLDLFFTGPELVRGLLAQGAAGAHLAVLEGVMGYYDGADMTGAASSWQVAAATHTPAVLVVTPGGAALSVAALVRGFAHFRPDSMLRGVVLNACSRPLYEQLAPAIERESGLRVYGYLPALPECAIESRHLGLVTPQQTRDIKEKLAALGTAAADTLDLDGLLALAGQAPPLTASLPAVQPVSAGGVNIAVARDEAFCFYYAENLALLEALGARLQFFSPLHDSALPAGATGLYLGGGYPELMARPLSENTAMRGAVAAAVAAGLPTLAECGGFIYLQQAVEDENGTAWPMAGALPGRAHNSGRLVRFGYATFTAVRETMCGPVGEGIRGHEFHHWDSSDNGDAFTAEKPHSDKRWPCIQASPSLLAGWPHLYFWSNPAFARRFVQAAAAYAATVEGGGVNWKS